VVYDYVIADLVVGDAVLDVVYVGVVADGGIMDSGVIDSTVSGCSSEEGDLVLEFADADFSGKVGVVDPFGVEGGRNADVCPVLGGAGLFAEGPDLGPG